VAHQAAVDHYAAFVSSSRQQQALENWENLARQFEAVAEKYPACHKADDALFTAGQLRFESYQLLKQPEALRAAAATFQTLIQKYPGSTLADDAQFLRGRCFELLGDPAQARLEYQLTIKNFRRGDKVREARDRLAKLPKTEAPAKPTPEPAGTSLLGGTVPLPAAPAPATPTVAAAATEPAPVGARVTPPALPAPAQLLSIRYWSSKDYTRVVVDFDREVAYQPPHLLKPDPALGAPPRLYLDFAGTVLSPEFKQKMPLVAGFYALPIGDGLLKKARAGQPQATASRVVLDLESITSFRCFPLPGEEGGFRVVIDIDGQKKPAAPLVAGATGRSPLPEPAPPPA
jgi:N-acetylmuramoyl-L-alanine amidase